MCIRDRFLIGEHDFKSFCSVNAQVESTVRTIYSCEVQREGTEVVIRISGGGFLYNMVRIIAGTLMDVGNGKYPPETVADILKAKERTAAQKEAPSSNPRTVYWLVCRAYCSSSRTVSYTHLARAAG